MAEELEHTAHYEEDNNEEIVERGDSLDEDTDGHEEQGGAFSNHSHPRHETSRAEEDEADRTTLREIHTSSQTFRCWHDSSQSSEIEDFVCEPAEPSSPGSEMSGPEDGDYGAWASPSNPRCAASFGDHGTTATAGAYGQLVQFSGYLGAGNSGMFSAGHTYTEEPYLVTQRARQLQSLASGTFDHAQRRPHPNMFGLKFLNLELSRDTQPSLRWFQYQWPRYEYSRCFQDKENIRLTIQFIVRDRTVFQQCILENLGETEHYLVLAFCKGMSIWDLDHVTDDHEYNKTSPNDQNAGLGPGGFGWVHVNKFREGSASARMDSQQSSYEMKSNSSRSTRIKKDNAKYGAALVVSMAVDGKMIRFSPGQSPHMWTQILKAKSSTSQKLEIVTAYKLVLLADPLTDWKTFVVPLKEMNPSKFLSEAKALSSLRTSITRISGKDDRAYSYDKRHSETLQDEDIEGEAVTVHVSQDGLATVDNPPQTESSPAIDHEPTPEKTSPTMGHIEFAVRRNLEHILGVCAIPVAVPIPGEDAEGTIWEDLRDVQPIALTCGDMSGHRICSRSSFFSFQFLAEVAKRLSRLPKRHRDHDLVEKLHSRIKNVCLGHLKWLCAAEKTDQDGAFRSLYWVTGEAVTLPKSSKAWVPREQVRNTAFQILKALEFANAFNDDKDGNSSPVNGIISQWAWGWVRWLERSDRQESLTWYHRESEGLKVFRLDDHIWIWRALKGMEDKSSFWQLLYAKAQRNDRSSSTGPKTSDTDKIIRYLRKFTSRTVQQEVLRKFTAEHEILRKKMVALTRSLRETRFLLHARDTALLYGQDMGFFPEDASFRKVWKNTIDAQRFHEHNQEARWDNALRYALSIMLGIRGHQINNRKPGDMVRKATEVLLESSSENGLFPGKLDIMTKGPLQDVFHAEDDADSYYDAGFEIPYIFLTHAKAIGAIIDEITEPALEMASGKLNLRSNPTGENLISTEAVPAHNTSNLQGHIDQREEDRELRVLLEKLSDVLSALPYLPSSTSALDSIGSRELAGNARLAFKKAIPFNSIIDHHSIVKIEGDWLFPSPDFFGSEDDENTSIDKTLDSLMEFEEGWLTRIDVAEMRRKYSSQNNVDGRAEGQGWRMSVDEPEDSGLSVMDMPSRKRLQEKRLRIVIELQIGSLEFIWDRISKPRTVTDAKKRMIVWSCRDTGPELEAALLCYAASKGDERENMLEFFERHFRHESSMFDHCHLAGNTWNTEVHLSFFILEDAHGPLSVDTAWKGAQSNQISRGAIGFRFNGDAFDRYWTLHLFSNLKSLRVPGAKQDSFGRDPSMSTGRGLNFQRKVLELHFLSIMLSHAEHNMGQILERVKSELDIKSGAFSWSIPSMDTYSSWSRRWERLAPLLQALADNLTSTQDIIGQWEAREGARGQDRPRWTHNDERKHRAAITRAQRVLKWRKKGIQDLLDKVESLREACPSWLANAREELSFRSNQNIASFTYVTIVFLPLGFAASVFSMSGYPAASWVASMAVIAVVTLAITATALANAKLFLAVADRFSESTRRLTDAVFKASLIGEQERRRDKPARDSPVPNKPSHGDRKGREPLHGHTIRHVLFWMAYLLIELPARRVALACRTLPASFMQILGLPRSADTPPAAAIGRKFIRVIGGILILPLLLISWTTQLFFYNALDILTFLARLTRKMLYTLAAPSDPNGSATDTEMVTWLIEPPPSLRPVRKYMSRDEKSKKSTSQADTPVAADKSDPGPLEDV